ncbi:MAG: ABC transporter permease [Lachnospiraceae bacterium]|nr:ABC transporter permease [Lachnospiraceae bacterium]
MKHFFLKRILISVLTLLLIVLVMFILLNAMPGTPFTGRHLKAEQLEVLRRQYGLDLPVFQRYFKYLFNLLRGDFGVSYTLQKNMSVAEMLRLRLPLTLRIGLQAMLAGSLIGLFLGIISAVRHNTLLDPLVSVLSLLGSGIPSFVFALGLMYVLAFRAGLFPVLYSAETPVKSTILPSIALAMFPMANIARYTRAEMISVLSSDYISLAEAKGLSEGRIIARHALRNALIPILTVMAPMLVELITGSMVVENIFSVPGLGSLFVLSVQSGDYNVSVSIMFLYSLFFIVTMLCVDLLYGFIDPRIRLSRREGQ